MGGPDHLRLTAHLPHWSGLIHVAHQVRRIFNLDFEIERANDLLGRDPLLSARIASLPGLRVPGAWDPFEVGVRAIVVSRSRCPEPAPSSAGWSHAMGCGSRVWDSSASHTTFPPARGAG